MSHVPTWNFQMVCTFVTVHHFCDHSRDQNRVIWLYCMTSFLTRRTDWGLLKAGLVTKTKLLVGFVFFKWHEAYTRVCFTLLLAATNWLHQDLGHSWRFQYNLTTRAWVLRTVSNLEVLLITSYFNPRRSLLLIIKKKFMVWWKTYFLLLDKYCLQIILCNLYNSWKVLQEHQ